MSGKIFITKYQPEIRSFIEQNEFLYQQSVTRILRNFDHIESETDQCREKYTTSCLEHLSQEEDLSIFTDMSQQIYEDSFNEAYQFYDLVSDMKRDVYLNTLALFFHHWDKTFRRWLIKELNFYNFLEKSKDSIWDLSLNQMMNLCEVFGWEIKATEYSKKIMTLQDIVNVYKHGNGQSLEHLKQQNPEYLVANFIDDVFKSPYIDYRDLNVNIEHIQDFSANISDFWLNMPNLLEGNFDEVSSHLKPKRKNKKRGL
jgi:hypothetical protein